MRQDNSEVNMQGFGHIAFHVDDVKDVLERLVSEGGTNLGQLITREYKDIGILSVVYAKDPEGNIIELQNWS